MDIVFTVVVGLASVVFLLIGRRNTTIGHLSLDSSIGLATVADGLEERTAASAGSSQDKHHLAIPDTASEVIDECSGRSLSKTERREIPSEYFVKIGAKSSENSIGNRSNKRCRAANTFDSEVFVHNSDSLQ
ncbi:hypothetical protein HG531_004335 [Fusarium graminearum]|nr:hypothetical protein HG531_004335 [Fusarium graminearum]